jgi:hypothetical protein
VVVSEAVAVKYSQCWTPTIEEAQLRPLQPAVRPHDAGDRQQHEPKGVAVECRAQKRLAEEYEWLRSLHVDGPFQICPFDDRECLVRLAIEGAVH